MCGVSCVRPPSHRGQGHTSGFGDSAHPVAGPRRGEEKGMELKAGLDWTLGWQSRRRSMAVQPSGGRGQGQELQEPGQHPPHIDTAPSEQGGGVQRRTGPLPLGFTPPSRCPHPCSGCCPSLQSADSWGHSSTRDWPCLCCSLPSHSLCAWLLPPGWASAPSPGQAPRPPSGKDKPPSLPWPFNPVIFCLEGAERKGLGPGVPGGVYR